MKSLGHWCISVAMRNSQEKSVSTTIDKITCLITGISKSLYLSASKSVFQSNASLIKINTHFKMYSTLSLELSNEVLLSSWFHRY